jgi:hypothetical protein
MHQRIYFRLNWRDYFKTTTAQFKKLKKEASIEIYQKLYKEVITANNKKLKEHLIALDDTTRTVMAISSIDYEEVLIICQKFLEENEAYESCAEIRDALIKLQSKKPKKKQKEAEKLLLIKRN